MRNYIKIDAKSNIDKFSVRRQLRTNNGNYRNEVKLMLKDVKVLDNSVSKRVHFRLKQKKAKFLPKNPANRWERMRLGKQSKERIAKYFGAAVGMEPLYRWSGGNVYRKGKIVIPHALNKKIKWDNAPKEMITFKRKGKLIAITTAFIRVIKSKNNRSKSFIVPQLQKIPVNTKPQISKRNILEINHKSWSISLITKDNEFVVACDNIDSGKGFINYFDSLEHAKSLFQTTVNKIKRL